LDMASNYTKLGEYLAQSVNPELAEYGLSLTQLLVENISLPDEVEAALDKRTSMGVINDLNTFTQYQTADAIGAAARNPAGGGMSAGLGMGMGMAIADKLGRSFSAPPNSKARTPPLPAESVSYFLVIENKRAGPYDAHELHDQAANGALTKQTLVWREGMRKWRKANELPELASIWSWLPPPLPSL
jgi:hypothetical protein